MVAGLRVTTSNALSVPIWMHVDGGLKMHQDCHIGGTLYNKAIWTAV